jgi:hypothetical protein
MTLAAGLCGVGVADTEPTARPASALARSQGYERIGPLTYADALQKKKEILERNPRAIVYVVREINGWYLHVLYP